uniref:Uncharacterized protein n=1 Tax=Arundo donax TaxID=35708 RepID=A0A0A9EE94_ARUDO
MVVATTAARWLPTSAPPRKYLKKLNDSMAHRVIELARS